MARRNWFVAAAVLAGVSAAGVALATAAQGPGVSRVAQQLAEQEEALILEYFELADHDESGWMSFQEARDALGVDRDGFARFDTDRDGRVPHGEFAARYREVVTRGGVFSRPRGPADAPVQPMRSADGLLSAYDSDLNGALSRDELDLLLEDYRLRSTSSTLLLSQYDTDGSERLERAELEYVSALLAEERGIADEEEALVEVRSLSDLFGASVARPSSAGTAPLPPRIAGPVRPFVRLDVDRDGGIDAKDLETLQFPLTLSVRPATILAALDRDGSGALDELELLRAFEAPPKAPSQAP